MVSIQWTPGVQLRLSPGSVEDFTFNLEAWLDGDTLDTVTIEVAGAVGVVTSVGPTFAIVRLSGATEGSCGSLILTATATNGRVLRRLVYVDTCK